MADEIFVRRTRLAAPAERVFQWHARPGAFERLTPPWEKVTLLARSGGIEEGARATVLTKAGPLTFTWVAEHHGTVEGREFRDTQRQGPFKKWEHVHRFEPDGPEASWLEDRIEYAAPFGLGGDYVRRRLERLFTYRHRLTAADVAAHAACPAIPFWVTGSSGFVGSALLPFLTAGGHAARGLKRGEPLPAPPEGDYAVVHLAGESIASGRWTDERKKRIRESRSVGTRQVAEALAALPRRPRALVCASAIGYYGSRGDEPLMEDSASGIGFLAEVCREWEAAAEPAVGAGIRVVHLRFGMVLGPGGGALAKMLGPFKMGAGGRIGSGRQYISWISRDDALGAIHFAAVNEALRGPVNAVAPNPVTNLEFTKTLGRVLKRPTVMPMPGFAARLAFGEMADELLLSSQRVVPRKLEDAAFRFRDPQLEDALRHMMGRTVPESRS